MSRSLTLAQDAPFDYFAIPRKLLIEQFWFGAGILAGFEIPVIIWRAISIEWGLQLYIHLGVAICGLIVSIFRRQIPSDILSKTLIILTIIIGLSGVLSLGMDGIGYFWLALSACLVGLLYSLNSGLMISIAIACIMVIVGICFVNDILIVSLDLNAHSRDASAWFSFLMIAIFVPIVILLSTNQFKKTIIELMMRLDEQRNQLIMQKVQLDEQNQRLELLAHFDNLTGLPVAQVAMDRLQMAINCAERDGEKVSLLFIDLDGFKGVNDTYGHDAGDVVLKEVAIRLISSVRAIDTMARIGGDEFLAVLRHAPGGNAPEIVAEKIIAEISKPIPIPGALVLIGASIGIALFPDHAKDVLGLRRRADAAMYKAKTSGKNRFCFIEADEVVTSN